MRRVHYRPGHQGNHRPVINIINDPLVYREKGALPGVVWYTHGQGFGSASLNVDSDPDPAFQFNDDPDPTFHFNTDPAPH